MLTFQITDMHPDRFYLEGSLARSACHKMEKDNNGTATRPPKYKYNRTDPAEPDPVRLSQHSSG